MSFMQEAMRGYAFMNDLDRQKQSDAMAQEQFQMQKDRFAREGEQFDMQKQAFDQRKQLSEAQLKGANLTNTANQQKIDQNNLIYGHARMQANGVTPELLVEFDKNQFIDVPSVIRPEYKDNFPIAESVLQGKIHRNDPRALSAFNNIFAKQIKRTVGQKGKGGKIISDINVVAMHPSEDGKHMVFESEVTLEDGSSYRAPITQNRGTEDDGDNFVRMVPLEGLINHLAAQKQLIDYIDQEGLREQVEQVYSATMGMNTKGHKPPDRQHQAAKIAVDLQKTANEARTMQGLPPLPIENFMPQAYGMLGMSGGNLSAPGPQSNGPAAMELAGSADENLNTWVPDWTGKDKRSLTEVVQEMKNQAFAKGITLSDEDALRAAKIQLGDNIKPEGGDKNNGTFQWFENMKSNAPSRNNNLTGSSNGNAAGDDIDELLNSLEID